MTLSLLLVTLSNPCLQEGSAATVGGGGDGRPPLKRAESTSSAGGWVATQDWVSCGVVNTLQGWFTPSEAATATTSSLQLTTSSLQLTTAQSATDMNVLAVSSQ